MLAMQLEQGGASALSVLTEQDYFGGSLQDMKTVRAAISLPVLRKDFMVDPIQAVEARAAGADAILIIMGAMDDGLAAELHATADGLGMSVLLEAHDEAELIRDLGLPSPLLGVNNRDLRTFTTRIEHTLELLPRIPRDRIVISESGITSHPDLLKLSAAGARAVLVGESLMRAADIGQALDRLRGMR
jgi:indole-3-glycerol phosphate synthase